MGNLTLDTLDNLPVQCRSCVFWELSTECGSTGTSRFGQALDKEAWLSATLLDWGSCGRIAYVDDRPAGYVTYAKPKHVARCYEFPTGPPSADAAVLMTVNVEPEYGKSGLGRLLIQAAASDLSRRGIRAIETYGDSRGEPGACMAPADFFRHVGFKTVAAHPHYPRLRLDLHTLPEWETGAESLQKEIDAWLHAMAVAGATRAGFA